VPMIAVVEVSSSLARTLTFSAFFALEIAMSLLRFDRGQGSGVRDQKNRSTFPFSPTPSAPFIGAASKFFLRKLFNLRTGPTRQTSSDP
jgi:hypothetical protein